MSPNEQKITSGRAAMATALSIISIGVTHTGQPGPWINVISRGSISSSAKRIIVWVWPPQISIIFHGRVVAARTAAASRLAASALRYSSRYFMETRVAGRGAGEIASLHPLLPRCR